jgi:transposase
VAGRQSKLTPEVQELICKALRGGNYFETACRFAGVSPTTALEWIARGEGREPRRRATKEYAEFAEAVRAAESHCEVRTVAQWQDNIPESWQAARDFLARRFPDRWGNRETIRVNIYQEVVQLGRAAGLSEPEAVAEAERIVRGEV